MGLSNFGWMSPDRVCISQTQPTRFTLKEAIEVSGLMDVVKWPKGTEVSLMGVRKDIYCVRGPGGRVLRLPKRLLERIPPKRIPK